MFLPGKLADWGRVKRIPMMRKCIRRAAEMLGGLAIRDTMDSPILSAARPETSGVLPENCFGDMKTAVGPRCGYIRNLSAAFG